MGALLKCIRPYGQETNHAQDEAPILGSVQGEDRLGGDQGGQHRAELASRHRVHTNQITQWKRQALDTLPEVFGSRRSDEARRQQELIDRLYQQIGQLKVELDWVNKNSGLTVERKRMPSI